MEDPIKTEESYGMKTEYIQTERPETESKLKEKNPNTTDSNLYSSTKIDKGTDVNKTVKNNKVLKRKFTEDGVIIERVLSEGETSSGFETVSSVDSNLDINELDDLELTSLSDSHNDSADKFNVIVQFENELAYRNVKEPEERSFIWNNCRSVVHSHKKDYDANEHNKKRLDSDRSSKEKKYWGSSAENKCYKSDRKKWSSEREVTDHLTRQPNTRDSDRKTQEWNRRYRRSDSRSRHSRSSECSHMQRCSRSPERNVWHRTTSNKERRAESRHSGSFDKSSSSRRNSPPNKRRRNSASRSVSSVWNRLDSRVSPTGAKKEEISRSKKESFSKSSRKKERTPFLVELERKLKEAERLKSSKKESTSGSKDQAKTADVNDLVHMLQVPVTIHQTPNPSHPSALPAIPAVQEVYPLQYQTMPALSVDNLPLVPGPTGLPVHISVTGEHIPHDMDGKRIPIGPNGYYLPVDPTGRLFAHIISPANQAIPIHMTDDGVLRLPNSEPVPFGPYHQLPVNIDGSVIFIGPDSKPLYPCPNLPREPPLNLINMVSIFGGKNPGQQQTVEMVPQTFLMIPQGENQQLAQTQPVQQTSISQIEFQPSKTNPNASNFTQNPLEESSNEFLKNCKKIPGDKTNDFVCIETEKNSGVVPKAGMKRSIPLELLQKKAHKDDSHKSGSDNSLVSSDSVTKNKSDLELNNGLNKATTVISEENYGFLEVVCGNKSFTIRTNYLNSDDPIIGKTKQAIKSLSEMNYKPPVFGRFIVSELFSGLIPKKLPNESPLIRNRIKLPFVTPNAKDFYCLKKPVSIEKTNVAFKFLPLKPEKGERTSGYKYKKLHGSCATKFPVFTFDFAVQCDFTSVVIKNLNSKITELETEVVRLKKVNANLLVDCRNAQASNEKKSDELRKARLEIQERNCEINALKCSLEMPR